MKAIAKPLEAAAFCTSIQLLARVAGNHQAAQYVGLDVLVDAVPQLNNIASEGTLVVKDLADGAADFRRPRKNVLPLFAVHQARARCLYFND